MKLGLLLIAMGYGYRVYADALKEKGTLRSIGQWVGMIMMATSLVASSLTIYAYSSGKCPVMHGRPFGKGYEGFLKGPVSAQVEAEARGR